MITVIAVCDICIVLSVCDTYTWSIIVPLSCVGFSIICCKPCNLNIVQQWVFDVIDTSLIQVTYKTYWDILKLCNDL